MNLFMIWGTRIIMSNSEMLIIIEIVLGISLIFQVGYLMFVYRALKRMSKSINIMAAILESQVEERRNTLRKTMGRLPE